MAKGLETKLKWQNAHYALEFTCDESFEFEQVITKIDLTPSQQDSVINRVKNADRIVVEAV